MPTRYLENVNPRTRFAVWAWGPVVFLRVTLFLVYAAFFYSSVFAFVAGVPVLDLTTPVGYRPIWAVILGVSAFLSAIGAITDRWQTLERWATLVLSAALLTYTGALMGVGFAEGDPDRQFIAAISVAALILPVGRFVYLAAQSGKRKHVGFIGARVRRADVAP